MGKRPSRESLKTLERGLAVLTAVGRSPIGLGVSDLARAVGISRQSIYRALSVLERKGFVRRLESSGRYLLATGTIALVQSRMNDYDRMVAIQKLMDDLGRDLVWPVSICAPDGLRMQVWETTDKQTPLSLEQFGAGFSVPMLESASGRAFLSHLPAEARDIVLDRIGASSEPLADMARNRAPCLALLRAIRRAGCAMTTHAPFAARIRKRKRGDSDDNTATGNTTSLSVPVIIDDRPVLCIALRYFETAMSRTTATRRYLSRLRRASNEIAHVWKESAG